MSETMNDGENLDSNRREQSAIKPAKAGSLTVQSIALTFLSLAVAWVLNFLLLSLLPPLPDHAALIVGIFLFTVVLAPIIYMLMRQPEIKRVIFDEMEAELLDDNRDLLLQNQRLVRSSVDSIISVNEKREIIQWNDAATKLFGYAREEARGQLVDIIIPEKYLNRHVEGFKRYLATGEKKVIGKTIELEARRKDGTIFPVEFSISAHKSKSAHIITAIIRDISKRKQDEQDIMHQVDVSRSILSIVEATAKTVEIDGLLGRIVESVRMSMGCDIVLSYTWDKDGMNFRPVKGAGLSRDAAHFFRVETIDPANPVVKQATDSKSFLVETIAAYGDSANMKSLSNLFSWVKDISTAVVIPLMGRRAYLGLIVCIYTKENPRAESGLTDRDRNILEGICRHVSIVLEDARLYKDSINRAMELSHKMETIQVMQEIDRNILSALESQEIMETAASMISKIISCDRATVAIADRDTKGFTYAAGFGIKFLPKGSFIGFEDTIGTDLIESGMSQFMSDIRNVVDIPSFEKGLMDEGFLSFIRAPIVVKGEGKGFLCVGSKRPSAFTPEDMSTLETLVSQVGVALENSRLIKDIEDLFFGTVKALSEAIDAKSSWTRGHSERMTNLATEIGKEMGLTETELRNLKLAGLLHDLGKIGTYESILNKPDKLTQTEVTKMRAHPSDAAKILAPLKQLREIVPTIKAHHEFFNGSGYPDGLKGKDIPLMARILGVADAVDAMGADRPYRKGMHMEEILKELKACAGTQLDPEVVAVFLMMQNNGKLKDVLQ